MAKKKKAQRKLARELEQAQQEHDKLLKKLEKSHAKFHKREEKLRELETHLSELERAFRDQNPLEAAQAGTPVTLRYARLIYNPKSHEGEKGDDVLQKIQAALLASGIQVEVTMKTSGKVVREAAKEAAKNNEELVIVAGGDGTIEKAASQLVGTETALGIIPTGTMNNLARSLGVPLDINDAAALIGMGVTRKIDIGRVNVNAAAHRAYFLETAGLGLNALVFPLGQRAAKHEWKGLPGAIAKLLTFKATPVLVQLDDGQEIQANAHVITVSNAPLTGMNFMLAPEAKMDDGWLDVGIFDDMSKGDLLGYLMSVRNATRVDNAKVKRFRARHVRIRPRDATPVVSDKDALPEKQTLDIELIPQGLKMIVGKGMALTFPVDVAPSVPPLTGPQQTNGHKQEAAVEVVAPQDLADDMQKSN